MKRYIIKREDGKLASRVGGYLRKPRWGKGQFFSNKISAARLFHETCAYVIIDKRDDKDDGLLREICRGCAEWGRIQLIEIDVSNGTQVVIDESRVEQ